MKKYLVIFAGLILAACAQDCSECEQKLLACSLTAPIPVDLPAPESDGFEPDQTVLKVIVNAEDKYVFEANEFGYDELAAILLKTIIAQDPPVEKIKIEGDRMAHYEAIFRLITFAKENELSPILVYQEK